jgi:hypothetical protein
VTDPREGHDLDPDGVMDKYCPSCKAMVAVRTRVTDGTRYETCSRCGHSFGPFVAGTFDPTSPPDL